MANQSILSELPNYTRKAVRLYWQIRLKQSEKQRQSGGLDQGFRSAVTGGAQMNGFTELLTKLVIEAGVDRSHIYYAKHWNFRAIFDPTRNGTS